jgi:ribonuclease R
LKKRKNASVHLRDRIVQLLKEERQVSLTLPQIISGLGMQKHDKNIVNDEMKKMQDEGLLIKSKGDRYGLPERLDHIAGVLQGHSRGFAFLRPDLKSDDIFISPGNLRDAAHGDRVMVRLGQGKSRRRREGTVIGILKRGQSRLVGTLQREGKKFHVVPDDKRFPGPVQVSMKGQKQSQVGDKVVVEIEEWAHGSSLSRGKIVEHIGPAGAIHTERIAFKHKFDLPGDFPQAVIKDLENIPGEDDISVLAREQGREDLRDLRMVTIDDESARDFDDAVSLELLDRGGYRLGVHIADVSHYVREGKPLDREALKRGTSIYLVDRVIHMLPPLLSENMCSLQAEKDRLAVSAVMDIDPEGELTGARFFPSLIKVTERLTYQQVETHLSGDAQGNLFKDSSLPAMLDQMSRLAEVLLKRRTARGTLDLDMPEARIEVDDDGVPLSIEKRTMGRSESLIEEFMIYCNEAVADYLTKNKLPCLYRVHAIPTEEKLIALRETLTLMNIEAVKNVKVLKPKHLKELLEKTKGEKNERLVRYLVLRSLPQARYSADNEGHYGLASEKYCHFTSPIRRYPDLVVHRILKQKVSAGGFTRDRIKRLHARLPAIAQQASERERAAVDAERASIEIKKAEYMENKVGEVFTGIINGVANFGIFVELDNTVEGMVPIGDLGDDYYIYNEKAASLVGERTRKTFRMGDSIDVQVVRASREEGKITFAPAPADSD